MILGSYNWSGSYRKLQKQPFFKKMVNSHFAVVLGNSCILKNAFEETSYFFMPLGFFMHHFLYQKHSTLPSSLG